MPNNYDNQDNFISVDHNLECFTIESRDIFSYLFLILTTKELGNESMSQLTFA